MANGNEERGTFKYWCYATLYAVLRATGHFLRAEGRTRTAVTELDTDRMLEIYTWHLILIPGQQIHGIEM
jgi:hypothetical protein